MAIVLAVLPFAGEPRAQEGAAPLVIDEITSTPGFGYLDVQPAVNDDGEPQLLLMAWNEDEGVQSRSRDGEPVPYDASSPCPPCASE